MFNVKLGQNWLGKFGFVKVGIVGNLVMMTEGWEH